MYVITCSSCQHAEKSPFARVGAVMVCTACKTAVQLRVEDVKRHIKLKLEGDEDLFKLPVEEPAPVAVVTPTQVAPPTQVQAQDLEIHEDHAELADVAARRAEAARRKKPKPQAIAVKPGLSSGELAQHLAAKRRNKTLLVGGGVAAAALIGIVFLLGSMGGGEKDASKDSGTAKDGSIVNKDGQTPVSDGSGKDTAVVSKDGSPVTPDPMKDKAVATKDTGKTTLDPTKDKAVPAPPTVVRVDALPLGIDSWQPVNEPFRQSVGAGRVLLINDERQPGASGGHVFKAQVVSQGVASAVVSVALVNDEDRVYARYERPYFLVDGKTPRPLELDIPSELWTGGSTVCWNVQPIDTHVTNLTLLEDTLAEKLADDKAVVLRLSAYNSSAFVLKDAAFVIQSLDAAGKVLSQWRLKYPREVEARSWVKFEAKLPDGTVKNEGAWRILAAGLPTGAEVAPPVIEHQPEPAPGEREPKEPRIPSRGKGLFDF